MRSFELALTLIHSLILTMFIVPPMRRRVSKGGAARTSLIALLIASLALIGIHLLIEGYRWQMIPIYALTAINATILLGIWRTMPRWALATITMISGMMLVMGIAGLILLPVPRLPKPSGDYAIGTFNLTWVDQTRKGIYSDDSDEARELSVQVWYPAEEAQGRPLKWVQEGETFGRAMTGWVGLPLILLDQVGLIDTHTYPDLPLSQDQERYPVVIYSHGWGGTRNINQDQLEALASAGYIVISADHTYGALIARFEDGRAIPYNPDALPEDLPQPEYDAAGKKLITTFAADLRFMLDQIEALNEADTVVSGHIDLTQIGLFGHSTGGGAVMLACSQDARCKAALGMDTWVVPLGTEFVEAGLDQPTMLMNSEAWGLERNRPLLETFYASLRGDKHWIIVQDSAHYDFAMVPLFSPLAVPLRLKGTISGEKMVTINNAYLVAFFDRYLKKQSPPLFEDATIYPEVIYETK